MQAESILIFIVITLSVLIFFAHQRFKQLITLALLAVIAVITTIWSITVFNDGFNTPVIRHISLSGSGGLILTIDKLSAFFILVINLTCINGLLFAGGYLKHYYTRKKGLNISIHFFAYLFLYISMLLVVMVREGLAFLIAWEIMAIASFLLVIFDAEERQILKTGISYLVQMHIGMFFLLIAFLIVEKDTGMLGFDALKYYFKEGYHLAVFILFLAGFGIKAGLIPFHTWLPEAHPAAPSHVSGVMSGVMIKMGIYGILRVVFQMQNDLFAAGLITLAISLLSGLFGVMMAILQHDIKKLLAYHSIENIGIIGMGVGIGMLGVSYNNQSMIFLGFGGGILHILNHSLFKSLLFFSSGNVYQASQTRNIELLGGLMKRMPYTSVFFLVGSLAICGLPPLNGFISEYLIYSGMFSNLSGLDFKGSVIVVMAIAGLALIGGLAIFCFTKAFGITFLGEARTKQAEEASERDREMLIPQLIPVIFIAAIGIAPSLFVKPVMDLIAGNLSLTGSGPIVTPENGSLANISLISGFFVVILTAILIFRHLHLRNVPVKKEPTWGCGYGVYNPRMQYTSTSFAYNYNHLAKPVTGTKKDINEIGEEEIFPSERSFATHTGDPVKESIIDKPVEWSWFVLKKLAVMQTGKIQHYILYAFIFMLAALLLTYLKII